jgi:hypothetical protein
MAFCPVQPSSGAKPRSEPTATRQTIRLILTFASIRWLHESARPNRFFGVDAIGLA